jgi:hypothetical protein
LTAELEPVAQALLARAKGTRYFVVRNKKTGKFELATSPEQVVRALNHEGEDAGEFYIDKPDTGAIREVLERTVDRPKEQPAEVNVNHSQEIIRRLQSARARVAKMTGADARAVPARGVGRQPDPVRPRDPPAAPAPRGRLNGRAADRSEHSPVPTWQAGTLFTHPPAAPAPRGRQHLRLFSRGRAR